MEELTEKTALTFGGSSVSFGILKTIFDLSWKVIPVLWVAFQFYSNQDQLVKNFAKAEAKLTTLENRCNQLDRDLGDEKASRSALKQQVEDDREFYLRTHK